MNYEIKRLKRGTSIFMPQTVAEAVLIKEGSDVTTLDKAINKKVEIITADQVKSGISAKRVGSSVDISHINQITPNNIMQPLQIQYDHNGHIIKTMPLGKVTLNIGKDSIVMDGTSDQELNLGDDFHKIDKNILIRWNSYGTT